MKQKLRWLGVALLSVAALLFWQHISMLIASDGCLDSGGSYDYVAQACDHVVSHPHIPFYRTWSFWVGVVLSLGGFWAVGRTDEA